MCGIGAGSTHASDPVQAAEQELRVGHRRLPEHGQGGGATTYYTSAHHCAGLLMRYHAPSMLTMLTSSLPHIRLEGSFAFRCSGGLWLPYIWLMFLCAMCVGARRTCTTRARPRGRSLPSRSSRRPSWSSRTATVTCQVRPWLEQPKKNDEDRANSHILCVSAYYDSLKWRLL